MFEREIKRGMDYLDANEPGWADKIDLDKLNMSFGNTCVLGQLQNATDEGVLLLPERSGYFRYLTMHGLDVQWAAEHGFTISLPAYPNPVSIVTVAVDAAKREAMLQYEWVHAIRARKREQEQEQEVLPDRELVLA